MNRTLSLLALLAAVPALAQAPAGGEFQVNTYTTLHQAVPTLALTPAGDFVVTWEDENDGDGWGIRARRYDARGVARGDEFAVNTTTADYQVVPTVASNDKGDFVVVWMSWALDGTGWNMLGQRYDAQGTRRGGEFQANSVATNNQFYNQVAMDHAGNFVVAWSSFLQDGSSYGIFARRYAANGDAVGTDFRVNSYTTGGQLYPAIGMDAAGGFVIAWHSRLQDGDLEGIFAQRFSAGGTPVGGEFRVNTDTIGRQWRPRIGVGADGRFLVAWQIVASGPEGTDVRAQRYDAAGNPQGSEFPVNASTSGNQFVTGVAFDARGGFVVTWDDSTGDGSGAGVWGRRFHADGSPRGGEFAVNTYTTGSQVASIVGADGAGNFVVGWESLGQDGDAFGVFAQRYGGLIPGALSVDAQGNGILEPGESVDLRPSWRNVNGAAQTFDGGLSDFAGPAGAAYAITDGTGAYGTVADDTLAPCVDCYGISVSHPAQRPATHWDASVLESITPDVQGQQKRWLLHVGNSFTDVQPTSPFYRFVEALLHHSVTGGCTGTEFCPDAPTTREQMAVFVLVAKEGAGFAPPACVPPSLFSDVPESSPYCRWIEELSRRGIVSGCGGDAFCPGAAVSREQMAVFVLKTLEPALLPAPCSPPNLFEDVPETSPFCAWIEELARRGIASGCGGGNYCPASPVTREQMAVFLAVPFGLSLYGS